MALVLLLISIAIFAVKAIGSHNDSTENSSGEHYILRKGQVFATYEDYLRLFGVTDVKDSLYFYFQVHPQHPFITLWGPQYHHPRWLNDGDTAQLLPTITERWAPADALPELIALRNRELYYSGYRINDIRLTFMKSLRGDSLFTFIGAYRMSRTLSDTTKIVWERVADEVDLRHLDYLEELRHP